MNEPVDTHLSEPAEQRETNIFGSSSPRSRDRNVRLTWVDPQSKSIGPAPTGASRYRTFVSVHHLRNRHGSNHAASTRTVYLRQKYVYAPRKSLKSSKVVLTRSHLWYSEVRIPLCCLGFEGVSNPSHLSFHLSRLKQSIDHCLFLLIRLPAGRIGALTGAGVGLTIGFIFGSYSILRCVRHLAYPSFPIQSESSCLARYSLVIPFANSVSPCAWITPSRTFFQRRRRSSWGFINFISIHAQ